MLPKITIKCWICGEEFEVEPKDSWKIFCLNCTRKFYYPVAHLVTLTELKNDWENKKHILFEHPKTKMVTCIHSGEVFEAPIETQYFMTLEVMKNEFYPRLNKYGAANYGLIKDNWNKIIELEPEIEEMLTTNPNVVFMICKGIYEEMIKKNKR
jgi:ribosomal protein S27E